MSSTCVQGAETLAEFLQTFRVNLTAVFECNFF